MHNNREFNDNGTSCYKSALNLSFILLEILVNVAGNIELWWNAFLAATGLSFSYFLLLFSFLGCPAFKAITKHFLLSWLSNFSLGSALRPGRVMVLMCLSVCLSVCLSAPPPEAWTFRSKTDSKADNRRQSPGQATKLWTCQGQSMKAENRWQHLEQAKKSRTGNKTKNRQQSQRHVTKLALS